MDDFGRHPVVGFLCPITLNPVNIMKIYKYVGAGVLAIVILLISISYLETESNYTCSGTITKNGVSKEIASMSLQLKQYASLKQMMTGDSGKLSFGGSPETMNSYSKIEFTGNSVSIYSNEDSELGSGVSYGTFSTITNNASFYIDYEGEFEGNCEVTK
jgi:hypothetical protein